MRKNDFWLILVLALAGLVSYFLFRADPSAQNKFWWCAGTSRSSSGSN